MTKQQLAKMIDHANLSPFATKADIEKLCEEALFYNFASICVNPCNVALVKSLLGESGIKTCTVIGFPLGSNTTFIKQTEAIESIKLGANELDMVINIGALKNKMYDFVVQDINAITNAAKASALVKVIVETCYLNDDDIIKACEFSILAGADFVKTSTGYGKSGADIHSIELMRETVGNRIKIKASGGIKTTEQALAFIKAGADRIGTSSSIEIINGLE